MDHAAAALARNLPKLQAIRFLFWMHFVASVLVPFLRDWGGVSFTAIMFLNAWFMFWNFVLEVPTGTVADFWCRKASLVLGCFTAAGAVLVYASTPRFEVFLVGEVFLAAAFTLMSGADEALLYDSLVGAGRAHESKAALARLESCKLAGIVAGALLGSPIAALWGLRMPMLLESVPLLLAAAVALTLREPPQGTVEARTYVSTLVGGMRYFARNQALRVLALDMVVVGSLAWLIIWLYQPLLEHAGVGLPYFGAVHALMCLGQIVVLSNVARLEGLLGSKRRLLLAGALVPGLAFLLLGATANALLTVAGVLAAASFGLSRPPVFSSYMNKYIPSDRRATVLSTVSMLRTAAIMLINPIAGVLADWSVHGTIALVGCAALGCSVLSGVEERHLID
jgi:MFS family permease